MFIKQLDYYINLFLISIQQAAFERESNILWNFAQTAEEFVFKSIQDVLEENNNLKVFAF